MVTSFTNSSLHHKQALSPKIGCLWVEVTKFQPLLLLRPRMVHAHHKRGVVEHSEHASKMSVEGRSDLGQCPERCRRFTIDPQSSRKQTDHPPTFNFENNRSITSQVAPPYLTDHRVDFRYEVCLCRLHLLHSLAVARQSVMHYSNVKVSVPLRSMLPNNVHDVMYCLQMITNFFFKHKDLVTVYQIINDKLINIFNRFKLNILSLNRKNNLCVFLFAVNMAILRV